MRKIEFRAKRTDNDEWVYGYYFQELDFENEPINSSIVRNIITKDPVYKTTEQGVYEIDINTLGQYTGLYDKNGTKIFEGDIVKIPEDYDNYGLNAGEIYQVYFAYGGFRMKPKYSKNAKGYWLEDDGELEVIGNIFDNPELLKGEN